MKSVTITHVENGYIVDHYYDSLSSATGVQSATHVFSRFSDLVRYLNSTIAKPETQPFPLTKTSYGEHESRIDGGLGVGSQPCVSGEYLCAKAAEYKPPHGGFPAPKHETQTDQF